MIAIDKASWHSGAADFPADLDPQAGGTHIGFLLTWLINSNLMSDTFDSAAIADVEARRKTGREILFDVCDYTLKNEDLSEVGKKFVEDYYNADDRDKSGNNWYLDNYERTLADDLPSMYHVEDSWENYDLIEPVIDAAYDHWRLSD
ncbi:uncharacterized protein LMH87_007783 [Akanthomyces muscarius]|uniref:DUF7832 domain-containing protein n=2 Tax=Akanthomyces TaxID=150366 RepID=A0A168JCC1_CORDF|nr:uncharacterized protein LMH87_007783 [Akanthomyces muscarius]KAJ4159844.1 hypothetical protein LMH87_007783 [Akanthomyces muscarius]OAA80259.1 hypothetical protein LEL_03745 [Akanthomyces lecanii RCEF 1005]